MKKYFLLMVAVLAISISAFAIDVPKVVSDAFAKKFPGATNVKWGKESKNEYEAEFKLTGKSVSANFLTDGSWVETEMEITPSELPAAVSNAVKAKFPDAVYVETFKIDSAKGATMYEAEIKTGGKKKELILNADGSLTK